MLKNMQKTILGSLLGSIFGAVWGVWGVAEFKLRLQADFFSHLTRPAPQAGVRRMQNDAKMEPTWEPESVPNRKKAEKRHAKNDAEN